MAASFKTTHTFEARLDEARRIKEKFPGRVPIIVERAAKSSSDLPVIDKNKFLVPGDLTVSQFVFVVRKRLALSPEQSLCVRLASLSRARGRAPRASVVFLLFSSSAGFCSSRARCRRRARCCASCMPIFATPTAFFTRCTPPKTRLAQPERGRAAQPFKRAAAAAAAAAAAGTAA